MWQWWEFMPLYTMVNTVIPDAIFRGMAYPWKVNKRGNLEHFTPYFIDILPQ
jgi:hypothetical protein